MQEWLCGFFNRDVSLEFSAQGSHFLSFQSTWNNVVKPRQVSGAIQSQTMGGDVPSTVDTCGAR